MKYIKKILIPVFIAIVVLTINCFDNRASSDVLIKVPAGKNVTSYYIKVSGPGMDTIVKKMDAVKTIVMDIPAGNDRLFDIIVYINPTDSDIAFSYRGTTTVNLKAGDSIQLPISLAVYETKLVIGDSYSSNKIVQMTNFSSPSWKEVTVADVSLGTFRPWDIDFDASGRIYIANNAGGEETIIRIDSFDTSALNETQIVPNISGIGVQAIGIDRQNNYIYHTRGTDLRRTDINSPGTGTALDLSAFTNPYFVAIAVDFEGMLYLADSAETTPDSELVQDRIVKFDPNTSTIINTYSSNIDFLVTTPNSGNDYNISDIIVRSDYVYVCNYGGPNNHKIVQLNNNLEFVKGYGTQTNIPDTSQGMFYGGHHFAAIIEDKLYIVDENYRSDVFNSIDKLISMDDMNGTNWSVFDPTSIGQAAFDFYYDC